MGEPHWKQGALASKASALEPLQLQHAALNLFFHQLSHLFLHDIHHGSLRSVTRKHTPYQGTQAHEVTIARAIQQRIRSGQIHRGAELPRRLRDSCGIPVAEKAVE